MGFADAENHCALNVALYGRASKHWTLTERTRMDLRRDAHSLRIGPSRLDWHGNELTVEINEVTVPVPSRVIGTVHLRPQALVPHTFALDTESHHYWHPVAPCGRIEVTMQRPHLRWSGNAYFDCNFGDEPLEAAFKEWDWTRARIGTNTAVIYDITPRRSPLISLSLLFDPQGGIEAFAAPPRTALPGTFWRMRRSARSANDAPHLIKTLEDTPFYARSLISASILGTQTIGIHESLSLGRVANPIVRAMLPFRMPRHRWRHN